MKTAAFVALAMALVSLHGVARADDAAPSEPAGHIPLLQLGASFATQKINFTEIQTEFDGSTHPISDSAPFIAFGVEGKLRFDLRPAPALIYADGFYNFLSDGIGWIGRGGVLVGSRGTTKLTEFVSESTSGDVTTTTVAVHNNKEIPQIIGAIGGVNLYGMRETVNPADGLRGEGRNPAALLTSIEAGFGLVGGQGEIFIAPAYELTVGQLAGRWSFQYAWPLGRFPLYLRVGGDHFFGSDSPVTFIIGASIGIGSGLGVSTAD
jgi:hypothetical protein